MGTIFTAKNLLKAYFDCRRTKRKTINALKFEYDWEKNLSELLRKLKEKSYRPGRSICFVVTLPKPREIFAADFEDRIIHHLLINEIQKIWEKKIFINDSYACRKGKGHHFGAAKASWFCQKFSYYGQFDIHNFFASINKRKLWEIIESVIEREARPVWWRNEVLWLIKIIIFNDPTKNYHYKGEQKLKKCVPVGKSLFDQQEDTGLPIGNLTSQFFANVYLNELDQFVKNKLQCQAYCRYVDDFLIFDNSIEKIVCWRNKIDEFLQKKLHLKLNPRKQNIQPTHHGVAFVGYYLKPKVVYTRRNVVQAVKNKIYNFNRQYTRQNTQLSLRGVVASLNSYYGHLRHSQTFKLRRHLYQNHLSEELQKKLQPLNARFSHLKIVRDAIYGVSIPN